MAKQVRKSAASSEVPQKSNKLTELIVRGARVHNLKNVNITLPRNKLVVITGVSGSGKSSLAFDTIYAEGQRRYVESLSSYARQFLERMEKPDVDLIQGISPAIAIEQKTTSRNPRSTVATTTEVYDYLRLLFGRIGKTFCSQCGSLVERDSVTSVIDKLNKHHEGAKVYVQFPMHDHEGRSLKEELAALKQRGFFRLIVNGVVVDLNEQEFPTTGAKAKTKKEIRVLVDRLVVRAADKEGTTRLADSIQTAFNEGDGYCHISVLDTKKELKFTQHFECRTDGIRYEEPEPRLFSFNNPVGACPKCQGFGRAIGIDMNLVVPDPSKTLMEGAVAAWNFPRWREYLLDLFAVANKAKVRVDVPYNKLTTQELDIVMNGFEKFDGIVGFFRYLEKKSYKIHYRVFLSRFRGYTTCDECGGSRLRKAALNIKVAGKNIHDLVRMTVGEANEFIQSFVPTKYETTVAKRILEEVKKRLKFLNDVGIGYITLDRLSMTLSGGESQRINLATSLGSSLMGALYVLDEPSIGLHPRDNDRLMNILKSLRDLGNTVLVVEHDEEMIREADVVVDMGPRAGEFGGEIVFVGNQKELNEHPSSITAQYLNGEKSIRVPGRRRKDNERSLFIKKASENNLKNIDVRIPLGMFVCITGVSGSGKSTLVHDIFSYAGIQKQRGEFEGTVGKHAAIQGIENIARVEMVDQSPIGRSPRSNATTYLKIFDLVRDLLSETPAAKTRGFKPGHFSFNVPGGRCETCEGDGVQKIEMQFLADLYLTCETCKGKRFKKEVLDIRFKGKNVDDILSMTVTEAIAFFGQYAESKRIAKRLSVLNDVGLGYVRLGQPATTLSGGEAQRIKLALNLAASEGEGKALFIFDEPTTGLHFDDIAKLLTCFDALIEAGHSLVVIEHNMDVIKCADYVIDLGPEAGDAGGTVVATGTPEEIVKEKSSFTGRALKKYLAA